MKNKNNKIYLPEPDELERFRFCKLLLFGNANEIGLRGGGGGGEAYNNYKFKNQSISLIQIEKMIFFSFILPAFVCLMVNESCAFPHLVVLLDAFWVAIV